MALTADLPVIDLSGPEPHVAQQLLDAAIQHGFLYIRNLGKDISSQDVDGAFSVSKKLFEQTSQQEKERCKITTNNRGWAGMGTESLDPRNSKNGDLKEVFNFGAFVNGKANQPIPNTVQPSEATVGNFINLCEQLCQKILYLLGVGLGVGDFLSAAHVDADGYILRMLRYPPADSVAHSDQDIRAGAHSDYGSITLLFRLKGQAGLELLKPDGSWVPVPVCPPGTENDPSPPILVNIGDLLSFWTRGLLRSTVHRVTFPAPGAAPVQGESNDGARYSVAFFDHPVGTTKLDPVPSERVKNFVPQNDDSDPRKLLNPDADQTMTADEHLLSRLKATYGTLYTEKS